MNDLNENTLNPNCFEKTKEAWGIFSFFSSTKVETKNVCPIAYNVRVLCAVGDFGNGTFNLPPKNNNSTNV